MYHGALTDLTKQTEKSACRKAYFLSRSNCQPSYTILPRVIHLLICCWSNCRLPSLALFNLFSSDTTNVSPRRRLVSRSSLRNNMTKILTGYLQSNPRDVLQSPTPLKLARSQSQTVKGRKVAHMLRILSRSKSVSSLLSRPIEPVPSYRPHGSDLTISLADEWYTKNGEKGSPGKIRPPRPMTYPRQ